MAGHNKWSKIKRKKGINDAKRGQLFTKLSRNITMAAQQGGSDPDSNFLLRLAIEAARESNMTSDNIQRAIKKGTGELNDGEKIVEAIYEAYVADGIALLIKSQTDNTNRAITEIRQIIEHKHGGKLAPAGSILWQFSEVGQFILQAQIYIPSNKFGKDGEYRNIDVAEMEMTLLDLPGVLDIQTLTDEDGETVVEVLVEREQFAAASQKLAELKYRQMSAEIIWKAKELVDISDSQSEKLENVLEALDDSSEVANTWHNGK
jgi:YebC/PmpR family DNA-binding regulatory protein